MSQIHYYFATISSFAYIAGQRLEAIAAKHNAEIVYKPLDLLQLFTRTGGLPVGERHPSRQEYRLQELKRQAEKNDMPITLRPMYFPTNSAPSSYAIIAAQTAGGGDMGLLVHSLLRACWLEEKNIAEDEVIKAALAEAGFDPALADSGLFTGAEVYSRNLEDAVNAGVFGSPFYITDDDQRFWGQDRLDDLDRYLSAKG